jgi:hypothetical protein
MSRTLRLVARRRACGSLLDAPLVPLAAASSTITSASWFTFLASAPYFLSEVLHEPPSTYALMRRPRAAARPARSARLNPEVAKRS